MNRLEVLTGGRDNEGATNEVPRPAMSTARSRATSVWPSLRAYGIIGKRTTTLNVALECWATVLKQNAGLLDNKQMRLLREALADRTIDPADTRINRTLADAVRDYNDSAAFNALAKELEAMSYVQVWACLWEAKFVEVKE